jgi:hypothetical protein
MISEIRAWVILWANQRPEKKYERQISHLHSAVVLCHLFKLRIVTYMYVICTVYGAPKKAFVIVITIKELPWNYES